MTVSAPRPPDHLSLCLARLLGVGSWASCGLIAAGMAWRAFGAGASASAGHLVSVGVALLIALPPMRVAAMAGWFPVRREPGFALAAAAVLAIILASTLLAAGTG